MLTQIHIRDLATIEELQLTLPSGISMITGETGAGKSIFIEALELTLGGRASPNVIRAGKEKADISLCFDIANFPHVASYLKTLDLDQGNDCIIRRIITNDARSRCYVNGSPVTLQFVKELGELLFHLHGQHEQQVLLKSEKQREMLDRFADHLTLAHDVKHAAETWRHLACQIESIENAAADRVKRSDYLQFQLDELSSLKLQANEWQALEIEHHKLTHREELMRHMQQTIALFSHEEHQNILSSLIEARKLLDSMQTVEPAAKIWLNTLNSAFISLEDLTSELQNYLENSELDPEKLQALEERVSQIFNLARKHKVTPDALFSFQMQLSEELQSLNASDENLLHLKKEQEKVAEKYQTAAKKLSTQRLSAAKKLAKEITQTIRSLSLPHGEFHIQLEPDPQSFGIHGQEKIIFLIKTNPDQTPQPLAKVISGGELSRLSLAAHLALASRTSIPTLVFDEVDTGLSGATAEKIGKLLRKLGDSYQVFCVTHQPQVAACGHQHLFVEKYFVGNSTHTKLRLLNKKERTQEIARMLGGEKITEKTIEHAEEMLALI